MRQAGIEIEMLLEYFDLLEQGKQTVAARKELLLEQQEKLLDQQRKIQETLDRLQMKIDIYSEIVISQLPEVMAPFGKKILMTYGGGSIKKIGLYDKVKELLKDFEIYELSDIQPNPKYDPSVLDGVKICKENDIDVILAVGGGSVLDCSKAIATGAKYNGDPWDLISYKVKATASTPIVDIMTLAATGSEYDCAFIMR